MFKLIAGIAGAIGIGAGAAIRSRAFSVFGS